MLKLLLKALRQGAGRSIMLADSLCPPSAVKRDDKLQQQVDEQTKNLTLYQFEACPFCIKVRRAMRRLHLNIELKNTLDPDIRQELLTGGGYVKVPCLYICEGENSRWLYESDDIIRYLEEQFA